jgi:hypothetical protein
MNKIPNISSRAFWEHDFNKLNFKDNYEYIICKIFDYGKWNDIITIISFYGKNKVFETLINAENLTQEGLQLASVIFRINKSKFKCYTKKQYLPSFMKH